MLILLLCLAQEEFSKPHVIGNHFSTGPRLPLAGDFDADGFGDLACVYAPGGGIVDVSTSVRGMKLRSHVAPARAFGADILACAAGEIEPPKGADIALLLANGDVRVVHTFAGNAMKTGPVLANLQDVRGASIVVSGRIVVLRPGGKWSLLDRDTDGVPRIRAAAGGPDGSIHVIDEGGDVLRATLRGDRWETARVGRGSRIVWGSFGLLIDPKVPDGALAACDVTGDGADDLVSFQKDGDILLSVAARGADRDADGLTDDEEKRHATDPLDRDTDNDGLLDGWEVKGYAGFDFASEGFSPKRPDVLCFVQRQSDVDGAHVAAELKRAAEYYASIGIGFHARFLEPLAEKHRGRPWWELGEENLPHAMRGLAHYMVIGRGGGGQSAELGTMGGCGDAALRDVFIHEFGHQLGLGHTGGYEPAWCPLYRSLMNYAYSYAGIGYSRGEFASVKLIESRLEERLPFPYEKLRFLESPPYRFRLKAEGNATLVDWNRNGVFDPGTVSADINSSYSTDGGLRSTIGKTTFAPTFAVLDRAWLYSINRDGELECREHPWGDPKKLGKVRATGDPFALGYRDRTHLFVPTKDGIGWWSGRGAALEPEGSFPGREVSAFEFRGRLLALSWTAGETTIYEAGREIAKLPVRSEVPPAAVEANGELVVGFAVKGGRWQIARLAPDLTVLETRWVGGEKSGWAGNRRPQLFFEPGGEGRLHFVATGMVPEKGASCVYDAMTISDRSHDDGWLLKRYYDEWTTTRSPAAAAWHQGDLLLGVRWFGGAHESDDNLFVAHRGLGIQTAPMGDADDVSRILNYGLSRSILWMK